jgi:hypothetical protein
VPETPKEQVCRKQTQTNSKFVCSAHIQASKQRRSGGLEALAMVHKTNSKGNGTHNRAEPDCAAGAVARAVHIGLDCAGPSCRRGSIAGVCRSAPLEVFAGSVCLFFGLSSARSVPQ